MDQEMNDFLSHTEPYREETKDSKAVLYEWVKQVRSAACDAANVLHSSSKNAITKLDLASDYVSRILGQCDSMMTILKNLD